MKDDLSLFVGDHVGEFVDWLHYCLEEIKLGKDPFSKIVDKIHEVKKDEQKQTVPKQESKINVFKRSTIDQADNTLESNLQSNLQSNEDSKENSKQKTVRKEITFINEEKNESRKIEQSFEKDLKSTDQRPKRIYKRIVFNSDEEKVQNDLPVKRIRNQISITTSTPKSFISTSSVSIKSNVTTRSAIPSTLSNIRSKINPQSENSTKFQNSANNYTSSNRPTRINSDSQINCRQLDTRNHSNYKKSFVDPQSNLPSSSNNQPFNQVSEVQLNNDCMIKNQNSSQHNLRKLGDLREVMKRKEVPQPEPFKLKSKKPMIFKAMEEANKSSNLTSISLRKESDKPKVSLINRLGISSTATKEKPVSIETNKIKTDEVIGKDKRLFKFEQVRPDQVKLKEKTPIDDKTQIDTMNSNKEDLRLQLRKRKLSGDSEMSKNNCDKLVKNNQTNSDNELSNLKNKIKLKSQVLAENNSKKDSNKSDNDDEIKVIIKQELLQKLNHVQAQLIEQQYKLKQSSKDFQSSKKERCPSWPICNNQDKCQYHHPKVMCL